MNTIYNEHSFQQKEHAGTHNLKSALHTHVWVCVNVCVYLGWVKDLRSFPLVNHPKNWRSKTSRWDERKGRERTGGKRQESNISTYIQAYDVKMQPIPPTPANHSRPSTSTHNCYSSLFGVNSFLCGIKQVLQLKLLSVHFWPL